MHDLVSFLILFYDCLLSQVDLEDYVARPDRISGADINAICQEAGMHAVRENRCFCKLCTLISIYIAQTIDICLCLLCKEKHLILNMRLFLIPGLSTPGTLSCQKTLRQDTRTTSRRMSQSTSSTNKQWLYICICRVFATMYIWT